jgi:protein SCO1
MRSKFSILIALTVTLILAACQPYQYIGTRLEPAKPVSDLTFKTADGSAFKLSGEKDRTLILFFGYTNCPDICPLTMAQLKLAIEKLGSKANNIDVALVTVDPARDTPERIQQYASQFNPTFLGLRAESDNALKDIASELGIYYEPDKSTDTQENYLVMHTSSVMVFQNQALVLVFPPDTKGEDIAKDLAELIK